ncbi:polyamine aminopropyltransferase [Pelagibius marinus]|uniref:polyamine aminopropyltransferase n=1 Tax=Pelagibius marinus TaxID=2762760 RepID=UPI001872FAA8|nr:polyamine aminopropyltransferase [Pelagibius marinus]
MSRWRVEQLHADFQLGLRADKVLYDSETDHQRLVVFENETFGRVLTLDSVVQTTEKDEFIYHEMLAHLPVFAHGAARKVLIVGGGDGGMLEEVLKHASVEKVTQVEIDAGVIDFSKQYLPSICKSAYDDPRLDLVIADGADFVAGCEERYDVAIVDSTDPVGPGEVLFTDTFYGKAKTCLAPGGILVTQNGVPFLQGEELTNTMRAFKALFADPACYLATVPTYAGGPMAFGWGSDDPAKRQVSLETLEQRYEAAGIETRYYNPAVHLGAFALPNYIADLIS